jgi:hypothetical protein
MAKLWGELDKKEQDACGGTATNRNSGDISEEDKRK